MDVFRRSSWKNTEVSISHLLLNGGILRLLPEQEIAFLRFVAERKEPYCVSEVATPICPLYFDLDVPYKVDMTCISKWALAIQYVIGTLEPEEHCCSDVDESERCILDPRSCIVSASIRANKTGVHIIFPAFLVKKEQLTSLRNYTVKSLQKNIPDVN